MEDQNKTYDLESLNYITMRAMARQRGNELSTYNFTYQGYDMILSGLTYNGLHETYTFRFEPMEPTQTRWEYIIGPPNQNIEYCKHSAPMCNPKSDWIRDWPGYKETKNKFDKETFNKELDNMLNELNIDNGKKA